MDKEFINKLAQLKSYKEKFPDEEAKKQFIFNNMNEILEAIGSFIADSHLETKYINETVYLKTVYGNYTLDTSGSSASYFTNQLLNFYLKNIKELQD